ARVTFVVTGTTAAGFSGSLVNTAIVTSTNNTPGTLTAVATITVQAPLLRITKTPVTATVNATDPIGYTITVSNSGAGAAYGVNVSDPLPAPTGVIWSGVSTSGPTGTLLATLSSNTITDNLGTLAAGASVTFVVTGTTAAGFK